MAESCEGISKNVDSTPIKVDRTGWAEHFKDGSKCSSGEVLSLVKRRGLLQKWGSGNGFPFIFPNATVRYVSRCGNCIIVLWGFCWEIFFLLPHWVGLILWRLLDWLGKHTEWTSVVQQETSRDNGSVEYKLGSISSPVYVCLKLVLSGWGKSID
jgi:hypothetical protein